ncbi:DUF2818 family protein [Rhodoferax sp. TS-BS-61-7]|jgi:hypothetical protein|uniref:DUF2818 family protein n=1 Tax=Rhodoferax sp. TS-BS-61-7 TaxID=2094194 RepID=UPI000CF6809B|nr:DUF2818 family protein [Rhodoferax sp. TS-BS-61-7]PQA76438.1 DUF2818 domain-containing protein [Rhodoferax sp. TS-BS-61-7]
MMNSFAAGLVVVLALVCANLPFFTERLLGFYRLAAEKSLGWRLLELLFLYAVTGAVGLGLEHRAGQISPQGWEFYAITFALFVTFAFPGFVYRYLLKRAG